MKKQEISINRFIELTNIFEYFTTRYFGKFFYLSRVCVFATKWEFYFIL